MAAGIASAMGISSGLLAQTSNGGLAQLRGALAIVDLGVPASLEFGNVAASAGAGVLWWDSEFLLTWSRWARHTPPPLIAGLLPPAKSHQLATLARDQFMYPKVWKAEYVDPASMQARLLELVQNRPEHEIASPPSGADARLEFVMLASMIQGVGA